VAITSRFKDLEPYLDERTRRVIAAAEAKVAGRGGISAVANCTGMSRSTIHQGLKEIEGGGTSHSRIRRPGGGRKRADAKDPELLPALEKLVAPATRGDPMSPLCWTSKSTEHLAAALRSQGHAVSPRTVARLLQVLGYSLQANRKSREIRSSHPDRNAQFEFINQTATDRMLEGNPVVSVDTKKKELIGDFRNSGKEYQPKESPELVQVHDFITDSLGRVTPYGVYDMGDNSAWVSVGTDHDTALFAVETLRRWWLSMGQQRHPQATCLTVTADSGGSNAARSRLWKRELQKFSNEIRMPITVCHLPPGTSKWNKIEHRLFAHVTMNWRGKPLISHEAIVNLIASTTTKSGLTVRCELDTAKYELGTKVSNKEMRDLNVEYIGPHVGWSYVIRPQAEN